MTKLEEPLVGNIYSWEQLAKNWGGQRNYLVKRKGGGIICARLNGKLNPLAPEVMVVGTDPKSMKLGEEFCQQKGPIPLFIKEPSKQWRYKGRWEVADFTVDSEDFGPFKKTDNDPLTRVIFLRRADGQNETIVPPDVEDDRFSATEARRVWVQHFRRERNRSLVAEKKRQVFKKTEKLACEVCGFDFVEFYRPHGSDFCEVHHTKPLAEMEEGSATKLEDLAILCSNCHRMIHRIDETTMPSVEEFRAMLDRSKLRPAISTP